MSQTKTASTIERFFKDKHGQWTVIQPPNILLYAWIILLLTNLVIHSQGVGLLQSAVLFAWAYLELTEGTSGFRKTLGVIVLVGIVAGFFL